MKANEKKLGQENAFPQYAEPYGSAPILEFGVSKRLYLAGMAMQGLIAGVSGSGDAVNIKEIVETSYLIADELIKQEQL